MPISNPSNPVSFTPLQEGADIDGVNMPTGGSSGRGWLSAIWKSVKDFSFDNGRVKTYTSLDSITIQGSSNALATPIIPATDISNYGFISIQVTGNYAGVVSWLFSNDGINWGSGFLSIMGQASTPLTGLGGGSAIVFGNKQAKYIKVLFTSFSSGSANVTLFASTSSTTPAFPVISGSVIATTSLPSATALSDNLSRFLVTPTIGTANLLDNSANLVRWRSPNVSAGEGLGRGKVAIGTESISLSNNISIPTTGVGIALGSTYSKATMQLNNNSTALTAINCDLQGSLNNAVWFTLATLTEVTTGARVSAQTDCFTFIRYKLNSVSGTGIIVQFTAAIC